MKTARYPVHRMIQDMMRQPDLAKSFARDAQSVFEKYGLEQREIDLLRQGTLEAMTELGVHPNLQMKYMRVASPPPDSGTLGSSGPLDSYLARLTED